MAATVGTACQRMGPAQRQVGLRDGESGREGRGGETDRAVGGKPSALEFGSAWTSLICFLF